MIILNTNTLLKTLVGKGSIKAEEYVRVSKPGDWETHCTVKTEDGREEEYSSHELMCFGVLTHNRRELDIISEEGHWKIKGRIHISKNVRSTIENFEICRDCLYQGYDYSEPRYKYTTKELTDQEIIDILLNEILYDKMPRLCGSSLVGTTAKGIDKNPNYHDGNYHLNNGKDYTMTWCRGSVIIREGIDDGWYRGKTDVGRTIYEGEIDWKRLQKALINRACVRRLSEGEILLEEYPEIKNILFNDLKDDDSFKLNSEF